MLIPLTMKVPDPYVQTPTSTAAAPKQPFKALLDESRQTLGQLKLKKKTPHSESVAPAVSAHSTQPPAIRAVVGRVASPVPVHAQYPAATALSASSSTITTSVARRTHADTEAQRLVSVRAQHDVVAEATSTRGAESLETNDEKTALKVVDQIVRELLSSDVDQAPPMRHPHASNPLTMSMTPAPVPGATSSSAEARAEKAVALIEKIEVFTRAQRPGLKLALDHSLGAQVEIERVGPGRVALKLVGKNGPPSPETVTRVREELEAKGLKVAAMSVR